MALDPKMMRFYSKISGAVMLKVVLIVIGYFVGGAIDRHFHTYPVVSLLLITVAGGLGIWWIVRIADQG